MIGLSHPATVTESKIKSLVSHFLIILAPLDRFFHSYNIPSGRESGEVFELLEGVLTYRSPQSELLHLSLSHNRNKSFHKELVDFYSYPDKDQPPPGGR